jgi:hypothetical protein
MGKITNKASVGTYSPKSEMIRTRKANDIATVAHEIGHHLEKTLFGEIGSEETTAYYDELKSMATVPKTPMKEHIAAEGFAEFIAKYIADPAQAKEQAPKFYEFFEKALSAKDPQMQKALLAAREKVKTWAEQGAYSPRR